MTIGECRFVLAGLCAALALSVFCGRAAAQSADGQPAEVEINVTARQFEFSPKTITVHKGDRVKLVLKSEDVNHGFAIDEFKINKKVNPDAPATVEFTADREGAFKFYCSVYCGEHHEQMTGQLIVLPAGQEPVPGIHVSFDESEPGVAIVEAAGQRVRVDTRTRTAVAIAAELPAAQPALAASKPPETGRPRAASEPYDYRLVNIPTPKRVPRHSLNFWFTHRFSETISTLPGESAGAHRSRIANDLLGLDSFSISSLGVSYGITNSLYAFVYRSPICQLGMCKTIEIGLGYHLLDEAGRSPIALSVQSSVEGENNYTDRYTENIQAMVERSVTKYVHLFFSPAVSINSNGGRRFNPNPSDFFPPTPLAATLDLGQHTGSFGFGADARIRPSVSLMFEFTPRVGFKQGTVTPIFNSNLTQIVGFTNESEPEIGFGIEKRIGRHVFSLVFTNTQATTTARYNSSNLGLSPSKFVIGFNLFRRLH